MEEKNLEPGWFLLPEHMRDGMRLYIDHGIRPGSFMEAVLSNDLKESFARADHINRERLFDIVTFLYNHAPSACWGSHKAMEEWISHAGFDGLKNKLIYEQMNDRK